MCRLCPCSKILDKTLKLAWPKPCQSYPATGDINFKPSTSGDLSTVSAKVSALTTSQRDMASPLLLSTSTSSLDRLKELSTVPSAVTSSNDANHRPETPVSASHDTSTVINVGAVAGDDTLTEISSIRFNVTRSRSMRPGACTIKHFRFP